MYDWITTTTVRPDEYYYINYVYVYTTTIIDED